MLAASVRPLRQAFTAALPILAGYIVLGIPCGILGMKAGMNIVQITLLSLLFYSGVGQFMIPNMWLAATPIASIVISVSLVSTRQILYAAALSRFVGGVKKREAFLFAATVTDESFGINLKAFNNKNAAAKKTVWTLKQAITVNLFAYFTWALANILGAVAGSMFSFPTAIASFAMTSIFICLLFMQKSYPPTFVAAITSALGVIVCKLAGLGGPAILIGAALGIASALLCPQSKTTKMQEIKNAKTEAVR